MTSSRENEPATRAQFPATRAQFPATRAQFEKCAKPKLCPAIRVFACVCIYHYSRTELPRKLEQTFAYQWVLQACLFCRTTPTKARNARRPCTRPQIAKSPYWGISRLGQISLWRGQFNKLAGQTWNTAWASTEFSENRVGCRMGRMFSRMRASAGVSAKERAGKAARGNRNMARLDFLKLVEIFQQR